MKVILDTNIFISAFFWQGKASVIFSLAMEGKIIICVSREIVDEFQRVLEYPKFKKYLAKINKSPQEILVEFLEVVHYYPSVIFQSPYIVADPTDDKFLACAVAAQAKCIISGDKHLIQLKSFCNILILTPHQFLKEFNTRV